MMELIPRYELKRYEPKDEYHEVSTLANFCI
jgi:hypothetical protein